MPNSGCLRVNEPYRLAVTSAARRDLNRLPARVAPAIVEFITGSLLDNPARLSKPLGDDLAGRRSARRGDYRVVFRIDEDARTVLVLRVAHRADVYRSR